MNKDDIKKALEFCAKDNYYFCGGCAYDDVRNCNDKLKIDTLVLITKQEEEIEYRKKQYDNQIAENTRLHIEYDKAFERLKAQQREIDRLKIQLEQANARIVNCSGSELDETNAVKEFAEKLKERLTKFIWRHEIPECIFNDIMSELLKEYEK